MSSFSTPAIILRRIDFGDYDLIVTIFTLNKGKISVIAKSAKKSKKRFAGILELFSVLDVKYSEDLLVKRVDEKGSILEHDESMKRAHELGCSVAR